MCDKSSNPDFPETLDDVAAKYVPAEIKDLPLREFGSYKVLSQIAEHGQGIVYLAFDPYLNRQVIIKISKYKVDGTKRETIVEEGRALARLDHPNIATVYQLNFDVDYRPYLVMEHIEGRNLAEQLTERRIPPKKAALLTSILAEAVQYAHNLGVIHNDLKPANVVIREDGTPKIIDFGLAKVHEAFFFETGSSDYGGTIAYMSPEQAKAILNRFSQPATAFAVDERADIFSLGAILYELLVGERLYQYSDAREGLQMAAECKIDFAKMNALPISMRLQKACLKALEKSPADRFSNAGDFANELDFSKSRLVSHSLVAAIAMTLLITLSIWALINGDFFGVPTFQGDSDETLTAKELIFNERSRDDQQGILGFGGRIYFSHFSSGDEDTYKSSGELFDNGDVYEQDDVRITAVLEAPSYCFLFAVNPNGKIQLCFPESHVDHQKSPVELIEFPKQSDLGFRFTDGPGQQAFVLLQSASPLPSFKEWSTNKRLNYRKFDFRGYWLWGRGKLQAIRVDGLDDLRGDVQPLRTSADFVSFCEELKSTGSVVTAITFPVLERN